MKFTKNGVPILSDDEIEKIAYQLLSKVAPDCISKIETTPIPSILTYLEENNGLVVSITEDLGCINGGKIKGKTILSQGVIFLDSEIVNDGEIKYFMTAAHEIGHWLLHRNRKIFKDDTDEIIDYFEDDEYSFFDKDEMCVIRKKKEIRTTIDWLEHHAKIFAANLLMPREAFSKAILAFHQHSGISRNFGKVCFYDDVNLNKDYHNVTKFLQEIFKVSKQAVNIRLKELDLFVDYRGTMQKQDKEALREASIRRSRVW